MNVNSWPLKDEQRSDNFLFFDHPSNGRCMNSALNYEKTQPPFVPAEWASQHNYHWQLPNDDDIQFWITLDKHTRRHTDKNGHPIFLQIDEDIKQWGDIHHLPEWLLGLVTREANKLPDNFRTRLFQVFESNDPRPLLQRIEKGVSIMYPQKVAA